MNKFKTIALSVCLGILLSLVVGDAYLSRNANANSVDSTANLTLMSVRNVTTTQTAAAQYTQFYGQADCYGQLTTLGLNTVTLKLQHSPDDAMWADLETMIAQSVSGSVSFTSTILYGAYTRAVLTPVTNTVAVSYTLKCTVKDTVQ